VLVRGRLVHQQAFVPEYAATYSLKKEPWILVNARKLCSVRNYNKVVFGEGAKTSSETTSNRSHTSAGEMVNKWWSKDNFDKLCSEGSIYNMLCHMGMDDVAAEFRVIACQKTVEDLKRAMGVITIPKQVVGSLNNIDPILKCLWILEQRYNCRRFGSLNVQRLITPHHVVGVLCTIRLPMIVSFVGKHSLYNHVVVVWNGRIIDFESRVTYPVNEENVNRICGPNNPFVAVTRGYVILPSRKMKAAVKDFSDWGEKVLREQHSDLFMFKK
jgi:hypothetical protein